MGTATYLVAVGANMWTRWGSPHVLVGRFTRNAGTPISGDFSLCWDDGLIVASRVITSRPIGPGTRSYTNAVVIVETDLSPPELLAQLKAIERAFGRRRGRRWGNRPLDLDIIAWSGGIWASPGLTVPHPAVRTRRFVLAPLCEIAPGWRDPVTGLSARHLLARLDRTQRGA